MFVVSLILLMVAIFSGLAFFLRHLLTRNISNATSHLQRMLKDTAGQEEKIKKKIEEAELKYKETIEKAKKDAVELKEKAVRKIDEERDIIIEQAHQQSEAIIERAHNTSDLTKAELQIRINEKAIVLARELACQVIPQDIAQRMHIMWLDALIAGGIEGVDKLKIPEDAHSVEIICAIALTDEQRNNIKMKLQKILEREIEIMEKVDPDLVAGVVINIGNLVFDGSFKEKVKELVYVSSPEKTE
ncbi:MAG: F0F1 ATP synthase subunit delta [Candidatus Omnitrophota bacterium]